MTKSKMKCGLCRKKLTVAQRCLPCKCGGLFCTTCKYEHDCNYDYHASKELKKQLADAIPSKIDKI